MNPHDLASLADTPTGWVATCACDLRLTRQTADEARQAHMVHFGIAKARQALEEGKAK